MHKSIRVTLISCIIIVLIMIIGMYATMPPKLSKFDAAEYTADPANNGWFEHNNHAGK